jgi:DNA modification methylase
VSFAAKRKDKNMGWSKEEEIAWGLCNKGVRHGGQSTFPYAIIEKVLKFYSEKGDLFLDPTMGDPTIMTAAYGLGRNFIGYDISEENFKINEELRKEFLEQGKQRRLFDSPISIQIYKKSSENMEEVPNESVDVVFFSPPYWDLEYYGEEEGQLGYHKTYEEFLEGLGNIIKECYRTMKFGKYCVININDFVKGGKFYDYHMDVKKLMDDAGFRRHDTIIMAWRNCIGQAFATQVEDWKKTAKMHEYIIVGKKVRDKDDYRRETLNS